MTHRPSFAQAEFATKKKTTRREKFLARIETLLPWAKLLALIEPFYSDSQKYFPGKVIFKKRLFKSVWIWLKLIVARA